MLSVFFFPLDGARVAVSLRKLSDTWMLDMKAPNGIILSVRLDEQMLAALRDAAARALEECGGDVK